MNARGAVSDGTAADQEPALVEEVLMRGYVGGAVGCESVSNVGAAPGDGGSGEQ